MSKIYIYSTLANDQRYTNWIKGGGDVPVEVHNVLIKGGAGVANDRFVTPLGVVTEIDDFDLEELRKNAGFNQHEKDGFVSVSTKKVEAEKAAANMNLKDESAPMTDADYTTEDDSPKIGKK